MQNKYLLKNAEDSSVVIVSIGELTNLRDIIKANKELFVAKVELITVKTLKTVETLKTLKT